MSRKAGGAEKVDLPCCSVVKPKGIELQFAASDQGTYPHPKRTVLSIVSAVLYDITYNPLDPPPRSV